MQLSLLDIQRIKTPSAKIFHLVLIEDLITLKLSRYSAPGREAEDIPKAAIGPGSQDFHPVSTPERAEAEEISQVSKPIYAELPTYTFPRSTQKMSKIHAETKQIWKKLNDIGIISNNCGGVIGGLLCGRLVILPS